MGKKKGYNVAEIDFKQEEDKKTEKKESFTVQDYDAIAKDMKDEEPCKQLEADDSDQDEIDDDSSHESDQDTNEYLEPVSYKGNCVDKSKSHSDVEASANQQQSAKSESSNLKKGGEQLTSKTNEVEPVSHKDDNVDDDQQLKKDQNVKKASKDETKSNLDDGASTNQAKQSATESSNLKASGQYTSIDLGEIKHAPKNSAEKNWFKRNLFYVIGIVVVVGLIAVISIAASSRKQPISDDKDELMPRKAQLPEGFQPATDESENPENYNPEMNSTAPSFEPTTNEMTTQGMNGDTTPAFTHQTETQHNIPTSASNTTTPPVEMKKNTDGDEDDDYDYPSIDSKKVSEDTNSGSGDASLLLKFV